MSKKAYNWFSSTNLRRIGDISENNNIIDLLIFWIIVVEGSALVGYNTSI